MPSAADVAALRHEVCPDRVGMKTPDPHLTGAGDLLGPIKGYTSLIQDDNPPGSNTRWWADKIMRDVSELEDRLATLHMLRLDDAPPRSTTWRSVITRALAPAGSFADGVRIEVFNEAPSPIVTRESLLSRALFQIIRNAVEAAAPVGWVNVRVVERLCGNDGCVDHVLTVEDNGPGIPRGQAKNVCRPFFTTRLGRHGLGLPYVEAVAKKIGMGMKIESGANGGTIVSLKLNNQGGQL